MKWFISLVAVLGFGLTACAGSTPAQEEPKAAPEVAVENPQSTEEAPAVEEPAVSSEAVEETPEAE